ncbi:MAG: hypothetical protein WCS33_00655 [Candidatus Caldatribacteriota bacterium]
MKISLEEFKNLPSTQQDDYIADCLPIINFCNSHMISTVEVMILTEMFYPLIEEKCLLGDTLRGYLQNKIFHGREWR